MIYLNKFFVAGLSLLVGLSLLISGCTLEDETAEHIVIPSDDIANESLSDEELSFFNLAKDCSLGKTNLAKEISELYLSTLPPQDINSQISTLYKLTAPEKNKMYSFQKRKLNIEFEKCLYKAVSDGLKEYTLHFISKAGPSARIAQHFYANKDYTNGSYWALRVVNLLGKSRAYYILGLVFIKDSRTVDIGAQYLSESAKLGNDNAKIYLTDNVLKVDVFDLLNEKENN